MSQVETVLGLKQWGNNLGVRLPLNIARAAHFHVNQQVRIAVEEGRVIITPVELPDTSLEERLARFDPVRHGGEVMTAELLGAEKW